MKCLWGAFRLWEQTSLRLLNHRDCRSSTAFHLGGSDVLEAAGLGAKPLDSVSSGATPRRLTEKGKPLRKRNLKVDWWRLMASGHHRFFLVVIAFGGVVDCAVWFLRFSTESLGFVLILDIWWSGWHGQASFHSSSSKAVLLAEASCYLPALLKFNTWAILSLLISSDQSRFTILGLIE